MNTGKLNRDKMSNTGIAAKVPNVPGAFGAKPLPKPNARKWIGLVIVKQSVDLDLTLAGVDNSNLPNTFGLL